MEKKKPEESNEEIEKQEQKTEQKIGAEKKELVEKTEEKKKDQIKIKKHEAIARGDSLPISKKHSIFICEFIKNKEIDLAMKSLNEVIKLKRAVPFRGEIPHRKGMMSGRYPVKAASYFINLLKGLRGNALVNGLDLSKTVIYAASANWASRPARAKGGTLKRTNILLKAREFSGGI